VILATGTKTSTQVVRRPEWLYFDMAERANNRNSEAPVFSAV